MFPVCADLIHFNFISGGLMCSASRDGAGGVYRDGWHQAGVHLVDAEKALGSVPKIPTY